MAVDLIISRNSSGANIQDRLVNHQTGINHGEVTNNVTSNRIDLILLIDFIV